MYGAENVVLSVAQMPAHAHAITLGTLAAAARAKNATGNRQTPVGNVPAIEASGVTATYSDQAPDASMGAGSIALSGAPAAASAGSGLPVNTLQPSLTMSYCIALQGIFPSRN